MCVCVCVCVCKQRQAGRRAALLGIYFQKRTPLETVNGAASVFTLLPERRPERWEDRRTMAALDFKTDTRDSHLNT